MTLLNELNNREISTAIWLFLVFVWAMTNRSIRHSIFNVIKAFFNKKIIIPYIAMLIYIALMVIIFEKIGFWDISAVKDTVLWTFGSAFASFININEVAKDDGIFKNVVLNNLKFALILEFIANLYPFSLLAEFFVVPIVSLTVLLSAYTETKSEYKQVGNFLNLLLGVFGLFLLVFTVKEIVHDFNNFASFQNLRDLLLPPIFSIVLLPYIYIMALYSQYELFFIRIDFANKNLTIANYAKRMVLKVCNINLSKLNKISKKAGYPKVRDKNDVLGWFRKEEQ